MSDPIIGRTNFIRRPISPSITKPGQKVHIKFPRTARTYNVSVNWDRYDNTCWRSASSCSSSNGSSTWLGIGMLVGTIGGLLAKIFGGKKKTQQVSETPVRQYIPKDNNPNQPVKNNNENDGVDNNNKNEERKIENNEKVEDNNRGNGGNGRNKGVAKTGNSPAGWYRAKADGNSEIRGITKEELERAEAKGSEISAAKYVLDKVLGSKLEKLNPNQRAQLLNEIIKRNPSVFDGRGRLKKDADVTKLDIPSKAWIENDGYQGIDGVKIYKKNANGTNGVLIKREPKGQKTIMGNNGYYAVITTDPRTKKKSVKFYAPSENSQVYNKKTKQMEKIGNGDITGPSFAKHCPNLYKQIMAELAKANGTH